MTDQPAFPDPSRVAKMVVSTQLLIQALGLPTNTIISHARMCTDSYPDSVILTVEHPDLKALNAGDRIPTVSPTLKQIEFTSRPHVTVAFVNWGQ